jgi:hypothetical protein
MEKKKKKKKKNLVFPSCSEKHSSNSYPTSELHSAPSSDAYVNPIRQRRLKRKGKNK